MARFTTAVATSFISLAGVLAVSGSASADIQRHQPARQVAHATHAAVAKTGVARTRPGTHVQIGHQTTKVSHAHPGKTIKQVAQQHTHGATGGAGLPKGPVKFAGLPAHSGLGAGHVNRGTGVSHVAFHSKLTAPFKSKHIQTGYTAAPRHQFKPANVVFNPNYLAGLRGFKTNFAPFWFRYNGTVWYRTYYTYSVAGVWYWYWTNYSVDDAPVVASVDVDTIDFDCDLDDDDCGLDI